MIVNVNLSAY